MAAQRPEDEPQNSAGTIAATETSRTEASSGFFSDKAVAGTGAVFARQETGQGIGVEDIEGVRVEGRERPGDHAGLRVEVGADIDEQADACPGIDARLERGQAGGHGDDEVAEA